MKAESLLLLFGILLCLAALVTIANEDNIVTKEKVFYEYDVIKTYQIYTVTNHPVWGDTTSYSYSIDTIATDTIVVPY